MKRIGRYQVLQEIGRGGMATVYLTRDQFSGRRVAVKVLPPQFTHDPRFRGWFKREARAIAALEHAYIVPVYDFGEEEGQPYIVMRYMPGGTLADRITHQPLALADAAPIIQRLAEGLDAAHRRGIVHRDLKPRNVLFDDEGQAFLSDFGLARFSDAMTTISSFGLFGTPAYVSPEQADGGRKIDHRSDVYSLGVILYEMLAGQRPFNAETPMGLLLKHVTEPMPPINTAALGLPPEINSILGRALAKKPEDRFQSTLELADALSALVPAGTARPGLVVAGLSGGLSTPTRPLRPVGRGLPVWAWGGVLGFSLIAAVIGLIFIMNGLEGAEPTVTPSLTPTTLATLAATLTPAVSHTLAVGTPTPTLEADTSTPTPTLVLTSATPTQMPASPTETATATATRRPSTRTPAPPTATAPPVSPTPTCPPGEIFDPFLNRCRPPDPTESPTLAPP
jgi:serine/threonine-protein kinase